MKKKLLDSGRLSLLSIGAIFLIITFFYSCASDEENLDASGTNKKSTESVMDKTTSKSVIGVPVEVQQHVESFSQQIYVNVMSLENALNKNSYVAFNAQAMQMLNNAQTENDFKIVFEMAGIANSQEVINILKNNVAVQQSFISRNFDFYMLSEE